MLQVWIECRFIEYISFIQPLIHPSSNFLVNGNQLTSTLFVRQPVCEQVRKVQRNQSLDQPEYEITYWHTIFHRPDLVWEFNVGNTNSAAATDHAFPLTIIVMSSEKPSKNSRIDKVARSLEGKFNSLLHSSRSPSIALDPNSGNQNKNNSTRDAGTRWVTEFYFTIFIAQNFLIISSHLLANVVPVGIDHAPATAEADTASSLKQISSSAPETVSIYQVFMAVATNYCSFSTCPRPLMIHCLSSKALAI